MEQSQERLGDSGTVAVVHFFSERTDGVSLQIQENDRVLAEEGWRVIECSADASGANGFVISELDYSMAAVQQFKRREMANGQGEVEMERAFEQQVQTIKTKLGELIRLHQPDVVHLRNILSLPIHPAATVAMAECIAEHPEVGFLAQHHDFSFEDDFAPGDRKKAYTVPYSGIQRRVEGALLFTTPQVQHAVINSLMQKVLLARHGYQAAVIPDTFDFEMKTRDLPLLREQLGVRENDLVIGTMARIIPRKAMEVAIQFIVALRDRKAEFLGVGRGLAGRTLTEESRLILLLPQASGLDELENATYFAKLRSYAEEQGVEVLYVGDRVVAEEAYEGKPGQIPFYSLYQGVDLLLFPSYQEGFGNQFLEAVALGRGVVAAHLYPVMEADIYPRIPSGGIIALGTNRDYALDEAGLVHLRAEVLRAAVDQAIHYLVHPEEEHAKAVETRQQLKQVFDARVVGQHLSMVLGSTARRATTP